jgi:hypothetical protein
MSKLTGISEYDINDSIFQGQKGLLNSISLRDHNLQSIPDEVYYSTDGNYQYILGAAKSKKKKKKN